MIHEETEHFIEIDIKLSDGTLIGTAEIEPNEKMLERFVIFEPYQNKGYGQQVLSDLIDAYKVKKLWVRSDNEKLKLLLDTGEYDFIKYIPEEKMWKLIFALAYIEDTIPMSDIDGIKAEITTEISDYEGCADFNEGIRFGLRTALEIIDKHISGKESEGEG